MQPSVSFTTCQTDDQLRQILALQKENLRFTKSEDVERDQGFVTVSHTFDTLKAMNEDAQHIIALDGDQLVGYALAMTKKFKHSIPELVAMFNMIDRLSYHGTSLQDTPYIVMGQICVAASHRGLGVFDGMYKHYFEMYKPSYSLVITEVAKRNTRSMRAHERVGFETLHTYKEEGSEDWVVIAYAL